MRGSLTQRYKGSWTVILDLGYETDVTTGKRKRKQKWITVRGSKREAETKLAELVRAAHRGEFVEPTKMTLGQWLNEWVEKAIKPPQRAQSTYDSYTRVISAYLIPALGSLRLQSVRPLDLEAYYGSHPHLSPSSLQVHHAILHSALDAAVRGGLLTRNVAQLVSNKPKKGGGADVLDHVWTAEEASKFLAAAKAAGPQQAAFYSLALDTGARRGELASLKWSDLDTAGGKLTIQRHLQSGGHAPVFSPTKTGTVRAVELSAETLALLRAHKAHQSEIKLRNRQHYRDHGLMFAKEWADLRGRRDSLGAPLQVNNIGAREFDGLIRAAGVKRIKFHGMRHTVATLMLAAGVPAHVVQRRLGHAKVEMTLGIYAHALPSMQLDAAERLARLLHG